jgi:DNA ligase D-like protein (predicted 3'-phosphoesterase)
MPAKDPLKTYRAKRDFRSTPEPSGGSRSSKRPRAPRFVVHAHDATSMHYDVRLEAAGVLFSWAVPKGPSTDPRVKRLAMRTEDHPIDYIGFEGVIPEGQYGAGPVIVWDTGTYRNLTENDGKPIPVERGVQRGHVAVWLEGEKLRGGYAFTRTGPAGKRERWLMVKMKDEMADARRNPVRTQTRSVVSGRTLREIARESA